MRRTRREAHVQTVSEIGACPTVFLIGQLVHEVKRRSVGELGNLEQALSVGPRRIRHHHGPSAGVLPFDGDEPCVAGISRTANVEETPRAVMEHVEIDDAQQATVQFLNVRACGFVRPSSELHGRPDPGALELPVEEEPHAGLRIRNGGRRGQTCAKGRQAAVARRGSRESGPSVAP